MEDDAEEDDVVSTEVTDVVFLPASLVVAVVVLDLGVRTPQLTPPPRAAVTVRSSSIAVFDFNRSKLDSGLERERES